MLFRHPTIDLEFEVPDSWSVAAGAAGFRAADAAYNATFDPEWPTELVPIATVVPPQRDPSVPGLREERSISILRAFVYGDPLPPVEVHRFENSPTAPLLVRDGYHRYFLSLAAGFNLLPVTVRPYFAFDEL